MKNQEFNFEDRSTTKNILALVFTFILCFGVLSVAFAAENKTEIPEGYTGIYTAEDLNNVRNNLSGKYILMNDIDLSVYENWVPITKFTGVFNGNSKLISNLKITDENYYTGLFGYVKNAILKNITVNGNINVTTTESCVIGMICAEANGTTEITNCITDGSITVSSTSDLRVGGILGKNYITNKKTTVSECKNKATITVSNILNGSPANSYTPFELYTGGIVGEMRGVISQCANYGNITTTPENNTQYSCFAFTGGICGLLESGASNCYNVGNIHTNTTCYDYISNGGIAGEWLENNNIENCHNIGKLTGEPEKEISIGGIVGGSGAFVSTAEVPPVPTTVSNCYYIDNTATGYGTDSEGEYTEIYKLIKEEFAKQESFTGFDFENVWEMNNEKGYPVLIGEPVIKENANENTTESTTQPEKPTTSETDSSTEESSVTVPSSSDESTTDENQPTEPSSGDENECWIISFITQIIDSIKWVCSKTVFILNLVINKVLF